VLSSPETRAIEKAYLRIQQETSSAPALSVPLACPVRLSSACFDPQRACPAAAGPSLAAAPVPTPPRAWRRAGACKPRTACRGRPRPPRVARAGACTPRAAAPARVASAITRGGGGSPLSTKRKNQRLHLTAATPREDVIYTCRPPRVVNSRRDPVRRSVNFAAHMCAKNAVSSIPVLWVDTPPSFLLHVLQTDCNPPD
jgi:hypothetical protein